MSLFEGAQLDVPWPYASVPKVIHMQRHASSTASRTKKKNGYHVFDLYNAVTRQSTATSAS